jgi:methylenetetrahydrofolate dehydrogenase (NADP+) / methenyltetrahydrofolate cyclohydrolase
MVEQMISYRSLDGRAASLAIRQRIAEEVLVVGRLAGRPPHLVAVLVGDDAASETYVANKVKACGKVGFRSTLIHKAADVTQEELISVIHELNSDPAVDGFIVQLPLPRHIDADLITLAIDPDKDVDGFHPVNMGRMVLGLPGFRPATPAGIVELLRHYEVRTAGRHCVVVGRSNIVGTPMSILMSRNSDPGNCTVTLAHSRTKDLSEITRQADILIVAIGKPEFIKAGMVRPGAVVVDVGIHRIPDLSRPQGYRLTGDVDFAQVAPLASMITPVPGGVGPMTITSLLLNTLQAAKQVRGPR